MVPSVGAGGADNLCAPAEPLTSLSSTQSQLAILLQVLLSDASLCLTVGMSSDGT